VIGKGNGAQERKRKADNRSIMRKKILFFCLASFISIFLQSTAYAGFFSGLGKALMAPLQIPKAMLQQGPITGVVSGTVNTVSSLVSGVGEMAQGATSGALSAAKTAAPYAKYAAIPFIL